MNQGRISRIIGPVVDVRFPSGELPPVLGALRVASQQGDRIIEVDGTSTQDTSTEVAADLLKGEQGTYVWVTVLAPDGSTRRLNIRRERVEVPSLDCGEGLLVAPQRELLHLLTR